MGDLTECVPCRHADQRLEPCGQWQAEQRRRPSHELAIAAQCSAGALLNQCQCQSTPLQSPQRTSSYEQQALNTFHVSVQAAMNAFNQPRGSSAAGEARKQR
jgi:hypothetical protein